jgi:hypothetical protein
MGRVGLIAGAVALSLVAAGAVFWSDIARVVTGELSAEGKLVAQVVNAGGGGGFSITFAESDAKKWSVAAGHRLERFSLDSGDAAVARFVSSAPLDEASLEWPSQGLSVQLPVEFSNRSNGKPIEIGIVARASGRPKAPLTVVYATRQAGNSGWQQLEVGGQFELKTLSYKVPKIDGGYTNPPVLVINADPSGNGGAIELLGVYVKIVGG